MSNYILDQHMKIINEIKNIKSSKMVDDATQEYTLKNGEKFWITCEFGGIYGAVEAFSNVSYDNFFGRSIKNGSKTTILKDVYEVQKLSAEEIKEFRKAKIEFDEKLWTKKHNREQQKRLAKAND